MYVAPEILFKLTQKPRLTPVYFYKTISMSVPKEVGKGRLFLQPSRKSVLVQIADEEMELMDMTMASQKSGASGLGHRPLAIYFQKWLASTKRSSCQLCRWHDHLTYNFASSERTFEGLYFRDLQVVLSSFWPFSSWIFFPLLALSAIRRQWHCREREEKWWIFKMVGQKGQRSFLGQALKL